MSLEERFFHGTSDTESIAYSIVLERLTSKSTEEAIEKVMNHLEGAYSCVVMTATKLIAFRDPHGFRPLCVGKTDDGAYIIASESCALDTVGAKFIRDVAPGEIITVGTDGIKSNKAHCAKTKGGMCVFEYIYFARPDSVIEGSSVQQARMKAGEFLAKESPVEADIVIGVPDSGLDAALGYSAESKIPYGIGFIKNKYIGRSFIQPSQGQREDAVRIKLNVVKENIAGKRVIMIDDSIVRGTTCARIVNLLREAGAAEVHMRVSSPPFKYPCYFGTDVDSRENLIACILLPGDPLGLLKGILAGKLSQTHVISPLGNMELWPFAILLLQKIRKQLAVFNFKGQEYPFGRHSPAEVELFHQAGNRLLLVLRPGKHLIVLIQQISPGKVEDRKAPLCFCLSIAYHIRVR